jgi:3-hydroxybutyryl-CoA dehydrogenase
MDVKTIGVIGAGVTGRRIAYVAAVSGYRTVLEDVSPTTLDEGTAYVREALEQDFARGRLTEQQKRDALANFSTASRVDEVCRVADLLIETVPEEMEVKLEIFTVFDKFAKPNAILASNSPSLSVTEMAAITFRTEDCVGMRFFDPVHSTKPLEIVRGLETSDATVAVCVAVGRRMGQQVIVVRDSPEVISHQEADNGDLRKGPSR